MEEIADSGHLPSWCDLKLEMIDRCIEKKKAFEKGFNNANTNRPNSGDRFGKENKMYRGLNSLFDAMVTLVSTELSSANPLEFQTDENTSLKTQVTRFNNLRRHELQHIETTMCLRLERQILQDIKRQLEVRSESESTRPELEYIQIALYALLKFCFIRLETLDTEILLPGPFFRNTRPALKRLFSMVSPQLDLLDAADLLVTGFDIRQEIRRINECIDVNWERKDILIDQQLTENTFKTIDPVLECIKAKFQVDVEQDIDTIKDAICTIERIINNMVSVPQEIDKLFEKLYTLIDPRQKLRRDIDALVENINTSKKQHIRCRQTIRYIFNTIDTMLEKFYTGYDAQHEKRQIKDAIETMMEITNTSLCEAIQTKYHVNDAIDTLLIKVCTLFDPNNKIGQIHIRYLHRMLHKIKNAYDSRQQTQYMCDAFYPMMEHFVKVVDVQQNVLTIRTDYSTELDRIDLTFVSRQATQQICDSMNRMLEKIITRINEREKIRYDFQACDSFIRSCFDERQCLLDVRIILEEMLETFVANERQITYTTCTWVNEERKLLGILTAVNIMLNKDALRADVLHKQELNGIQNVVRKMIESFAQRRVELQDIQTSVYIMLDRIAAMVNERGRFRIARIESCGSKAEHTAVWKHDETTGEKYTESDFLAILDYFPEIHPDNGCRGFCVEVKGLPSMSAETTDEPPKEAVTEIKARSAGETVLELPARSGERVMLDRLFWKELHTCLGSACNCFTVQFNELNPWHRVAYKASSFYESEHQSICSKCVVEMPTGILKVNDSVSLGGPEEANCSLSFIWTSKANTLLISDTLLSMTQKINSLSVHVDFLPALEVLKHGPDKDEHDYFLVPKHCDVCDRNEHWRKSNCMAEIAFINNEMSEQHRKCYKIMKYCLATVIDKHHIDINWYHVKTVALNHSRECSDTSESCAECVLKMLTELKHAYETKTLKSFHEPEVNMIGPYYQSSYAGTCVGVLQKFINRLCSVTETASFSRLLEPM